MSASSLPKRSRVRSQNRTPSPAPPRFTATNPTVITKLPDFETRTVPSKNGDSVFNPGLFLAKAGLGRKVVNLKKGEWLMRKATRRMPFST